MAGYTDVAFRAMCKSYGAGLTTTEMVSAKAICMNSVKTLELLHTTKKEKLFSYVPFPTAKIYDILMVGGSRSHKTREERYVKRKIAARSRAGDRAYL